MSDGCSKSHLEMVRLVRFRTVSDKLLYMIGKRMEFLIDMYGTCLRNERGALMFRIMWRIPVRHSLFLERLQ